MNINLKWIALLGISALVGLLAVSLLAGPVLAQGPGPWAARGGFGWGHGPGMMGGGMMRGPVGGSAGMMGGWGYGLTPTRGFTDTVPFGYGPGDCPGMGSWGNAVPSDGDRLTMDQAAEAVEQYLALNGDSGLELGEVMEFNYNFYAQVLEVETGIGVLELLIDPVTGAVHPEPGPNMMWNAKYGHMSGYGDMPMASGRRVGMGMMGFGYRPPTGEMTVSPDQAVQAAQAYLDQTQSGLTADDHADTFYGYYTLHTLQDGQVVGMLSVNGYTGQVWYHTWHGDFIGMSEGHE
jgi:hypothetical protein